MTPSSNSLLDIAYPIVISSFQSGNDLIDTFTSNTQTSNVLLLQSGQLSVFLKSAFRHIYGTGRKREESLCEVGVQAHDGDGRLEPVACHSDGEEGIEKGRRLKEERGLFCKRMFRIEKERIVS